MADNMMFELVSPARKLASAEADAVTIPGMGGDLTAMLNDPEMMTGGKVDKALVNAQAFTEAVYERLK